MGRKQKIAEEGLRMFNEQGVNSVGVRDIARALDISPGNMSYHFPRKEGLIEHILIELRPNYKLAYDEFNADEPGSYGFMKMVRKIMDGQYRYRGILSSSEAVVRHYHLVSFGGEDSGGGRFNIFRKALVGLANKGHLQLGDEDLEFLVSFLGFLLRFWIAESFQESKGKSKDEVFNRYLNVVLRQLILFATSRGRIDLLRFKAQWMSGPH